MSTSTLLIKHLVQTYDAVQAAKSAMQTKLNCLIESQPYYKIFEHEGEQHPYYALIAETQVIEARFSGFVGALLDWEIDGNTVSAELHKLQINQEQPSPTLAALSAIPAVPTAIVDCADLLRDLASSIALFRSHTTTAWVKDEVQKYLGRKKVSGHIEVPLHSISKECNAAYSEMKMLSKLLLDTEQNQTTLRDQLVMKQSMIALTAIGGAPTTDTTIALLLTF
jgi:hypothetical protein